MDVMAKAEDFERKGEHVIHLDGAGRRAGGGARALPGSGRVGGGTVHGRRGRTRAGGFRRVERRGGLIQGRPQEGATLRRGRLPQTRGEGRGKPGTPQKRGGPSGPGAVGVLRDEAPYRRVVGLVQQNQETDAGKMVPGLLGRPHDLGQGPHRLGAPGKAQFQLQVVALFEGRSGADGQPAQADVDAAPVAVTSLDSRAWLSW